MSEKPKDETANIYDEIRREMSEKQQTRRKPSNKSKAVSFDAHGFYYVIFLDL